MPYLAACTDSLILDIGIGIYADCIQIPSQYSPIPYADLLNNSVISIHHSLKNFVSQGNIIGEYLSHDQVQ